MQFIKPTPFKEALEKLDQKTIVTSKLDAEAWSRLPLALRERAFFSSEIESARFLQRARDAIRDHLTSAREEIELPDATKTTALKTGSRAQFVRDLQRFAVAEGMAPLDPDDADTIKDIRTQQRLELIFDTQTRQAQDYGWWQQGQDPDVLDEFPAQRFIREVAVKEPRDWHTRFEGEVHLKSDIDFWRAVNQDFGVPWGPWGWGCGHDVEDVDRAEAERLGLIKPGERAQPIEQPFNRDLQASVRGLDPDMIQHLKDSLGAQVKIDKDAAWWKGDRQGKALAVPPKPRTPKPAQPPTEPEFPSSLTSLETIRDLGGTTGATLVRDPRTGAQYVLKRGNSPSHIVNEHTTDELYRAMGVPVPEARLFEGVKPAKLARFIDGRPLTEVLRTGSAAEKEAILGKVRQHFAADALLGNWDVAGLDLDNILVDKSGTPWRIDNGGGLRFRAQGAAKTADEWNVHPVELWSMRDPGLNAKRAAIFGKLNIYDIGRQIAAIDDAKLLAAAPPQIRDTLAARISSLKRVGQKALDYEATAFHPSYADQVTKHTVGLRKADALAGMAPEIKQAHPGDVRPVDADGNVFDRLRTPKARVTVDPSQVFFDQIIEAAKTINYHHGQGDHNYNAAKIEKALAQKPALQKLLADGTDEEKAMAAHYLTTLNQMQSVQGDVSKTVPTITKHHLPSSTAGPAKSLVSQVADYMSKNGGDWAIIEDWANEQSSSSKSAVSKAVKHWLMDRLAYAKPDDFYETPPVAALHNLRNKWGEKLDRSLEIYHAFVQETLANMSFSGNDQQARLVRVLRTETDAGAIPFRKGQSGVYKRGVNESGSVFAPVFSGTRTVTAVPHTHVTGLYFMERTPGTGKSFFYGDNENEFTYMPHGLKTKNLGSTSADVNLSPGTDHTKWEVQ